MEIWFFGILIIAAFFAIIWVAYHFKKENAPKVEVYLKLIGITIFFGAIMPLLLGEKDFSEYCFCVGFGLLVSLTGLVSYKITKVKK